MTTTADTTPAHPALDSALAKIEPQPESVTLHDIASAVGELAAVIPAEFAYATTAIQAAIGRRVEADAALEAAANTPVTPSPAEASAQLAPGNGNLAVDPSEFELTAGADAVLADITGGTAPYSVTVEQYPHDEGAQVVTASTSTEGGSGKSVLQISPNAAGTATITVKDSDGNATSVIVLVDAAAAPIEGTPEPGA